ncbi:L-type lectin-domain containing receptor kinase IV.2-like [Alnus glutinosa]|uniref:L-type lectin-domain containing receptor kinase IV.2-like n=1 Tax=Alnus glutinosa TaxID=3517 RepID=UPI002D77D701|nr:L-type lectin-domain containing receptor kinase IV.2-like [Alnus glutinosa]
MAVVLRSLHFLILVYVSYIPLALTQDVNQFIYNGFHDQANVRLDGIAEIHSNGLLQLTNLSRQEVGRAFCHFPMKFNTTSSDLTSSLSFSTNFVFAIVPEVKNLGGHDISFTISPSRDFSHALLNRYLGLFNNSNNGLSTNHILAIELDTVSDPEFGDITMNHVGIDVNGMKSVASAPAMYFSNKEGKNINLDLMSGNPMHLWIDYDEAEKLLNVTLAPTTIPKPNRPLLSTHIDLSQILLESMYVGFSSATGTLASDHYILGWSFNKSGPSQSLGVSSLPPLPRERKRKDKPSLMIMTVLIAVTLVLITVIGAAYILRRKKYEEIREDWEEEYGPHRFSYKNLHKATKGFKDTELLGEGGFGKVYIGTLRSSNVQIAVKRISHDSKQGMKEFVAEIISMGRMRHRNLVQLLGYCRRRGELLLVYDYMPNGSLDRFLYSNEKTNLNWVQRFRIIKGVASGLLYLHEEWEQVVLHRDVKASNVLLDAGLNGRLGDFGLAKLYDHGTNPQTTRVVGTVGYLAPELTRTGRATTCSDVYAFGAFLLEVACGRRPIELQAEGLLEQVFLVDWVTECCRRGAILDTSDPRLEGNYVVEEMEMVLKLGLFCSHAIPACRPSMKQVVQFLDGDADLRELPYYSAYFGAFTSNESSDFMSVPFSQASAPSMSSTDSILRGGR